MDIRNECSALHKSTLLHVQRSLSFIYPPDLVGIGFVRLIDKVPLDVKLYIKEGRIKDKTKTSQAFYMPAYKKSPPYVALIVPKILRGVPDWLMWTPATTLLIAHSIAHEVGHHLISKRGYALHQSEAPRERLSEYEEEMVNRYAFEVTRKMRARWRYKFGNVILNEIASWRNIQGRLAWDEKNYIRSKEYFLQAWHINPDDANAEKCFRIAQAKVDRESQAKSKV